MRASSLSNLGEKFLRVSSTSRYSFGSGTHSTHADYGKMHDGRSFRFCARNCLDKFEVRGCLLND